MERQSDRADGHRVHDAAGAGAPSGTREDAAAAHARGLSARQLRQRADHRQPREAHPQEIRGRRSAIRSHRYRLRHGLSLSARGQVMWNPSQFLSRISIRLALFNLLVVFLPVAALLFIGIYEEHLEKAQLDSMERQARLVVSTLQSGASANAVLRNVSFGDERIRIISPEGKVTADTGQLQVSYEDESGVKANWLYRAGAAILARPLRWFRPITRPLASSDAYERSPILRGPELSAAFVGQTGVEKRVSSTTPRFVTLYTALPIYQRGNVIGAVLVSQTTD